MQVANEAEAAVTRLIRHAKGRWRKWSDVYKAHTKSRISEIHDLWHTSNLVDVNTKEVRTWDLGYTVECTVVPAVAMLRTYPDSVYILDLHPNVVRLMAASGNVQAIFLEGAVLAMHDEPIP